jgi:mannitol/fructose-specific phosphotransferase system IIA component (Ntr-type)
MFVALVIMALATSVLGGPLVQRILGTRKVRSFVEHLSSRGFVPELSARDAASAIRELAQVAATVAGINPHVVEEAALRRERIMSTGIERGVAIPHARIRGLRQPVVAVGLSAEGIDFDTLDGSAAKLVVLVVTPEEDPHVQLEILADVARAFGVDATRDRALHARNSTEFVAAVRTSERGFDDTPNATKS